nr:MAG TPA: hypothetical protein [Caudoviricetes sp.]
MIISAIIFNFIIIQYCIVLLHNKVLYLHY